MGTSTWSRAKGIRLLGFCALVGSAACVHLNRGEPIQRHFVLGEGAASVAGTPTPIDVTVGVRRLELASYLSTSFMAVRHGPNRISYSEFNRWGEPLQDGINRVVARALVRRGVRDATVAPWPTGAHFDYVIQISVARFEGTTAEEASSAGGAHVQATWEIVRQEDGVVLAQGSADYTPQGWVVGDYAGLVTLLDAGLDVLADDLAAGLRKLLASQPGSVGGRGSRGGLAAQVPDVPAGASRTRSSAPSPWRCRWVSAKIVLG